MPRNVKLDCFTVQIHQRGKPDEVFAFDEFFEEIKADGSRATRNFKNFFIKYLASFGNSFGSVGQSSRALHIASGATKIKMEQRVIYGTVEGGPTGYAFDLKNRTNAAARTAVTPDDVSAHKFYYLLWLPDDMTTGFLLLHGYSDTSISDLFRNHLAQFVRHAVPDKILVTKRFIDPDEVEDFRRNASIDRVILRRTKLSADNAEHLTKINTIESGKIGFDLEIYGLESISIIRDRILAVVQGQQGEIFELDDLVEYGLDGTHDTIVEYELGGKTYKAYKSKGWDFFPTKYLTDVAIDANGHVNETQMLSYLLRHLEFIKGKIGYTAIRRGPNV